MHFLLLFVFALVLALSLSATANAETVKEVNEAGDLLGQGPGNFKLMKNIVTSDTWEASGESSLDLNGYSLRVQTNTSVISVGANAKLTITDSDPSRVNYLTMEGWQGKFVSAEGSETEIDANGDGIVKVEGGFITGGQGKDGILAGGGITVTGGSVQEGIPGGHVIMNGGTIIGNNNIVHQDFDYGGAGVFVDARGVFEMKGGAIRLNHTDVNGGGVGLHGSGSFIHSDGSIVDNSAVSNGGGIYAAGGYGKYTLQGGTVSNNTASLGGGVCVRGHGVFEMTKGVIDGNHAGSLGGGVYLQRDGDETSGTGEINISGGEITGNEAQDNGGGVYYMNGTFKLSGSPVIDENVSPIADGSSKLPNNVAMANDNKITIVGELANDVPIGIVRSNEGVFTTGLKDYGANAHFVSNREGLGVYIVADGQEEGEARLGRDEWKSLQNALMGARDGDTFNVRDYDFDGDYMITAGEDDSCLEIYGENDAGNDPKKVTLNLNGITLDRGLTDKEAVEKGCVLDLKTVLDLTLIGTSVDNHVGTLTGGNNKDSFSGGGAILIGSYVDLTLQDGVITGNSTTGKGGGIYTAGTLTVKGAPRIEDNKAGDSENNVYLPTNNGVTKTITVVDDLTNTKGETALIGVTTQQVPTAENPVPVTGKVPSPYSVGSRFKSDAADYSVLQRKAVVYLAVPVKITYDKNSGAARGTMEPQTMYGGFSDALASSKFTWSGHTFKEWNTEAGGKGTAYKDGAEITPTGDMTLYAQWSEDPAPTKPTTKPTAKTTKPTAKPAAASSGKKPSDALIATFKAKGKKSLKLTWKKVEGASGYEIFFVRCNYHGKEMVCKKVKNIKGNKTFTWKKSGLKKGTAYKAYVKAYVYKNGKKSYVKTSPIVHAYTGNGTKKFTNAKSVSVNKTKVSLKKGKTFKIKAKVKKVKKSRKLMPKGHTAAVRYMTSNSRIATVNSGGRIKAKGKGSCYVYVYAHNGVYKKIKVTVR